MEPFRVEHRSGDNEVGPGVDLPVQAPRFSVLVHSDLAHSDTDDKARGYADRVPTGIDSSVQPVDHVGESDRVDVQ